MSSKYYSYFLLIENNLCHQNITHTFCYSKTINVIKILLIIFVNRKQFMSSKYYSYFLNRKQFVIKILLILLVTYFFHYYSIENNLCHQNITHTFCESKTINVIKILLIIYENNLCHQNITHTIC